MESGLVDNQTSLCGDLTGQVEGEAESVVQLKDFRAGQDLLMDFL